MISRRLLFWAVLLSTALMHGCKQDLNMVGSSSGKTGLKYGAGPGGSDGFQPVKYAHQPTAPGLVFIEGGTFHMGGGEKDIAYAMDNRERQVTVNSFYIDEVETANVDWKEFVFYYSRDSGEDRAKEYLPDTTVWFRDLAYNEPFVELYYQNPAFNNYPVVGITWYQANDYCKWRTTIVNSELQAKDPEAVLQPKYRLPTEAEWEYAARGLLEQENYPWEGKSLRNQKGEFMANFKRGRGDYAGRSNYAGNSRLIEGLNDRYMVPGPVRAYWPNDFGLYNMAGNVAEWTFDTYRLLAFEDVEDFQPYRRKGDVTDPLEQDNKYGSKSGHPLSMLYNPGPNSDQEGEWDRIKVYRGGAWKDIAYYLTCGSRRFWNADSSASYIGFRCAMSRVGSPSLKY